MTLLVALPSKGRLQEQTSAFLDRAGLPVRQARGARGYSGEIAGLSNAAVQFRSAGEIARAVACGEAHLAVTGIDLLHETLGSPAADAADRDSTGPAHVVARLGFGHADLVVAVPRAWIDVVTMADLADVAARFRLRHHRPMRVATKYVGLTRRFLTDHGVSDYLIVESPGATEGAPAAGSAEFIVDITSTGRTLADNGLKILENGTMLRSEAALVASLAADWDDASLATARSFLARISADSRARKVKRIDAALGGADEGLSEALRARFGAAVLSRGPALLSVLCPAPAVHDCAGWLIANGAATAVVSTPESVFEAEDPLARALADRLAGDRP